MLSFLQIQFQRVLLDRRMDRQAGQRAFRGRKGTRLAGARVDRVRSVPRTRVKMAGKGTLAES